MNHEIIITVEAQEDYEAFKAHERRIILAGIKTQLEHEPLIETRNRKPLRDNPIAPWELRIGKFRVFYQVEGTVVTVGAIGHKEHNKLILRGKEVTL